MEYLINARSLVKRYDGFTLSGIDLALEPGRVVGLVGPNGAGKTTTLKAILGLIAVDEGAIELLGETVTPASSRINEIKEQIGVVFDTCSFPATCTVRGVGSIGKSAYPTWSTARYDELCRGFGLAPRKTVSDLSRGMGMKLTLAFALSHDTRLLVLDEATAGLDPMAREEVLDVLRDYIAAGERGILMSTHITSDLEKIADEVVCVDDGAIVFALPRDAIVDTAGIAHCGAADLERVLASSFFPSGGAHIEVRGYQTDLLVPDRFAFARAFPDVSVEAAGIEDYMALRLKGEVR